MSALLSIHNVSKKFSTHKPVIDNLSLEVVSGEVFGLIGVNGAGKTTLIKCILDLLELDSGSITIQSSKHASTKARQNLYYLPEKFTPSPFLKGSEFLSLTLSSYRLVLNQEKMFEAADRLQLDSAVLDWKIGKYSKGMTQKLALMGALLADRPLLLLDEPMSGLDPCARVLLKRLLREYVAKGRSVLFSSHILTDIDEICNRIAVLHEHQLLYVGEPAEFRGRYGKNSENLEHSFLRAIGEAA